jgi:hypothetical protein
MTLSETLLKPRRRIDESTRESGHSRAALPTSQRMTLRR